MTLLIDPGYGLQFNGISDSVLVPVNSNNIHGLQTEERKRLPASVSAFTLETWFIPDSGGVVFEQENVMRLSVGSPSGPAPAVFEIRLKNLASGRDAVYTLSTAKPVTKSNGRIAYWDGILFPAWNNVQDAYLATDLEKNDISAFSAGHRELLNVTVTFDRRTISMHVNGDLAASQALDEEHELVTQQTHIYLGGRGGDFRGTLEAIHWSSGAMASGRQQYAPMKSDNTLALWRFEEPIEPISIVTTTPSISASTSASSSINIGTTAAQLLVDEMSGQSGLTSIDFTSSPYSGGSYKIKVYTSTSFAERTIPKVPYNIIINPLGYSPTTGKPTNKAPERLRLTAIDSSAGTITVESIHLDFESNSTNGRRGVLMAHDAGRFVVVTGDCIVDGGNGNEFQPQGTGTQFSQRQSQVIIDESDFENHGMMFSLSMAIDNHEYNAYSAKTTNMGNTFLIGHSGRHTLNHVISHPFMGTLPPPKSHNVEKKLDVGSDVISASFLPQFADIKSTVPTNSVISSFDTHGTVKINSVSSSSQVSTFVDNGMTDIDDTQRELLALGGPLFDIEPFRLKAVSGNEEVGDDKHIIPSTESRIAILSVPKLADFDYVPFVQIHYNAIDNGSNFSVGATSRLTAGHSSGATVLTLQSIRSFGADDKTIPATNITVGGVTASSTAGLTAKIDYSAKTLTFSSAISAAAQTAAVTGAVVQLRDVTPKIIVTDTLPSVNTVLNASPSPDYMLLDLIRDSMRMKPLELFAPGGIIEFDTPDMFPFSDGDLEGENSEGVVAENKLDYTLCPANYLPRHSTDTPQKAPQVINVAHSELSTRNSVFHRVLMRTNKVNLGDVTETADITTQNPTNGQRNRLGLFINNNSGYAGSTSSAMNVDGISDARTVIATGDTIFKSDGKKLGIVTAVSSTSVTIGGGTTVAVVDDDELFKQGQFAGKGTTNQSSCVHEYFDIIEHTSRNKKTRLIIQPSDRNRFNLLSKVVIGTERANHISIENLMARGRVLSFADDNEGNSVMRAHSLVSDMSSASIYVKGSAAPDSHIVKEIMPGAPVVSMTLGGPGQGAVNTKETWDPSPISRLAWNTRRDCQALVSSTTSTTAVVEPLNNKATDLKSWGTYCFPYGGAGKDARIYLAMPQNEGEAIRYAHAEYNSKTGTTFTFQSGTGHEGSGKFVLEDGSESDSFADWITATGIAAGSILHTDDKFSEETMCNDGTTINDRLFQTLDTVQHDYQLGSQYASTRALVEIPLFEDFFFDDVDKGIFPGPDNSMKLHLDCTHTAHSWNPNPVGRRADSVSPEDPEIFGPFSYSITNRSHRSGTKISRPYDSSSHYIYVEDANVFPIPSDSAISVAGLNGGLRERRAFLPNGEWVIYTDRDTSNHRLTLAGAAGDNWISSENFFRDLEVGEQLTPSPGYQDMNYTGIADNPTLISAGYESRRSFYYDRSNVMTQGGNVDYGLKQYVSAIELRAGPRSNPHLPRIQSKRPTAKVIFVSGVVKTGTASAVTQTANGSSGYTGTVTGGATTGGTGSGLTVNYSTSSGSIVAGSVVVNNGGDGYVVGDSLTIPAGSGDATFTIVTLGSVTTLVLDDASLFPKGATPHASYHYRVAWRDATATERYGFFNNRTTNSLTVTSADATFQPAIGDEVYVADLYATGASTFPKTRETFLNRAWAHPYAPGGLRQGDTVWMNMHYTNPHAIEGLFCKSRGTLNEAEVYTGFNGGVATLDANPRDSAPMENFLIGDTCIETAQNLVQHINQTIIYNYYAFGESVENIDIPVVAYLDPYQCTEDFARVLLYDVSNDREFIAFQDLWMQVQSSPATASIGTDDDTLVTGAIVNSNAASGSLIDVAAGFPSENKKLNTTQKSDFIEASYAHASDWNANVSGAISTHSVGGVANSHANGFTDRTDNKVAVLSEALSGHQLIDGTSIREQSTFFDTPDGTRAIPAFLAMKGIRNSVVSNTNRLGMLPHWSEMDFVRRLTLDMGEVALKDGVTDIEAAAREVVRLINQAGAKNGRTHARRPNDQFLGESDKFDLSSPGPKGSAYDTNIDPAASHQHADFAATASTHDPAPFWDIQKAFSSHDRGTHMGYIRAHLGRVVLDSDNNPGYSIVIHSTVPGASGRNFCAWLDNSRAQTPYRPQYLIGHGGRFRNYWCQPDEMTGENMHPAPMPINRYGRPFAPITTLKEYLPPETPDDAFINNLNFGSERVDSETRMAVSNVEIVSGRDSNTLINESFETKSPASVLVDGLRVGTKAKSRINFGGITQAGIPGWAPNVSKWGYPNLRASSTAEDSAYYSIYGNASNAGDAMTETTVGTTGGYIPKDDMKDENIGKTPLYGIRFVDHRGDAHTIRMVYRQYGQRFANNNTVLPPTLDEEVIIHFDDRDVAQGGFTIGKHMVGAGEVCGELNGGTLKEYKGNLWNTYPSPAVGVHVTSTLSSDTITVTLTEPYHSGGGLTHTDVLGYLGFPKSGMLQLSDDAGTSGDQGLTIHYTSRTSNGKAGPHKFFGITGGRAMSSEGLIMSPRINFTSLLTDEVIAAATEYAINMGDASQDNVDVTSFDCTSMLAPDGKTLGDWGVSPTAIRIKTRSDSAVPLNKLFEASRTKDWGLLHGASTDAAVGSHHTGGLSTSEMDAGTRLDVGYIPKTVLHINTKYRGSNANTATPILVDSQNNMVDITSWRRNLRGDDFTDVAGDHVIPRVDSPMIKVGSSHTGTGNIIVDGSDTLFLLGKPATTDANSWGEKFTLWYGTEFGKVRSKAGATCLTELEFSAAEASSGFLTANWDTDDIFIRRGGRADAMEIDGIRRAGSKNASPFLYFRGGRDSPDHWVPLFFGGGFSGAVVDINDGTQNDYSDFYTHPYANGPTGSAGFQNVGEIAGSYALLDANAMLAMFPGTPYLDQHKGKNHPPFFNQDAILSFDMAKGGNTAVTGLTYTHGGNTIHANVPTPIVLRFAHPHARYSASSSANDQTVYMIFGPGQAFPHNSATFEPQGANIVTAGNGYSAVTVHYAGDNAKDTFLPNQLTNGDINQHSGLNRGGSAVAHLPMSTFYQKNNVSSFNYVMNWEPTKGFPNDNATGSVGYNQTFPLASKYEGTEANIAGLPLHYHPFNHVFVNFAGTAIGHSSLATTRKSSVVWHMDGGYHPGGHFLDNHVNKNPKHPVTNNRLATGSGAHHNTSVFRPCGLLSQAYLSYYGGTPANQAANENVVVVDATRVQNAEELGTIISAAINTFPGKDPLKAIGGTFMPSMQNAHKQDRYGWVELPVVSYSAHGGSAASLVVTNVATTLPDYGWVRVSNGTESGYAPYNGLSISAPNTTITLCKSPVSATPTGADNISGGSGYSDGTGVATTGGSGTGLTVNTTTSTGAVTGVAINNPGTGYDDNDLITISGGGGNATFRVNGVTNTTDVVNPNTHRKVSVTSDYKAYIWTKSSTHRHNNSSDGAARNHMCAVHFSGYIDAVDRTKAIGAVGWHGEAYSYFNSVDSSLTTLGKSFAGLGAWHPFLGFSPYGAASTCVSGGSTVANDETPTANVVYPDYCVNGLSSRHLIAITHESELPLIAKADKYGISCTGDFLELRATSGTWTNAGTTAWDTNKVHNKSRYVGPATAGPHVDAQVPSAFARPTTADDYPNANSVPSDAQWHREIQSGDMADITACNYATGDLFWDESIMKTSNFHEGASALSVECIGVKGSTDYLNIADLEDVSYPHTGLFGFYAKRSSARNFTAEHVVWKRMDGGSLTMPATNARGLGMVPWVTRIPYGTQTSYVYGEKILGNVRFSFETTNAAMFPIIQAQELGHPQLSEKHPLEIRNALLIPNEDQQFKSMQVTDDTGQEHRLEGGSPLGTVIMDFRHISDRDVQGLSPALANAGVNPNLRIRLPNADEIPGNIIVRSGFDRIQGYQNETFGSGGLQHPAQSIAQIKNMFENTYSGPRLWPTWENNGWEHLSQDGEDVNSSNSNTRLKFPASSVEGWNSHTGDNPLETSYEPHDRTLNFHITRMGVSMTHRYDSNELTYSSYSGTEINVTTNPSSTVWTDTTEQSGGRYFLRVYDPNTDKGVLASYTGIGTNKFTGVVYSPDFVSFVTGKTGLKVVPSYYMPAGSTRMFASRRLRDHSEYSGASPDMKKIDWFTMYDNLPSSTGAMTATSVPTDFILNKVKMTPMPIPRMGHHYVTPTMAMMPGHYAHPAYQRLYNSHYACQASNQKPISEDLIGALEATRLGDVSGYETITDKEPGRDPLIWFSTPTAAFRPSDIHGGAFTLLTETKVKYEGYGIAASSGSNAGTINAQGGHTLVLEAAATYTQNNHFPDPLEVGAYQIIIQPNVFKQQLQGFHQNHSDQTKAPSESGDKVTELTGQQVNTVIAIERDVSTRGAYALILAEAMMADVRGCEVIINEVILDIEPDEGSQFTNLPPLALYNPLGVQETSSPTFSRRSLPYRPGMFTSATPGYTLTIPWWGVLHRDGATATSAQKWRHLEWHKPDNYYELCRASYGCIGAQITLAGYPTSFIDIYEPHKRIRSLNPNCVVISHNSSNEITVDDNALFPVVPYYGEVLEYTKNGIRHTATYSNRTGTLAHATLGESTKFSGVSGNSAFWSNLATGQVLKLSRPYDNSPADSIYTDSSTSIATRPLPQLANGSRDTNSLHLPDAFLCMWHPNLGRPFTWYSDSADGGTRNFYDKTGVADTPLDKKGYNHIPEHFETIHYQDFNYVSSKGPFGLAMKWIVPPGGGTSPTNVADGLAHTSSVIDLDSVLYHQGGTVPSGVTSGVLINHPSGGSNTYAAGTTSALATDTVNANTKYHVGDRVYNQYGVNVGLVTAVATNSVTIGGGTNVILTNNEALYLSTKYNFSGFWPGGSRGGGAVSRLESYGHSLIGWGSNTYGMDCETYKDSTGVAIQTLDEFTGGSNPNDRYRCFGYRMSVRQAYNRPRWSPYVRGWLEVANSNALLGYYHGPLIQHDSRAGAVAATATVTVADGDAASGMSEKESMTILSTDGTSKVYVLVDDNATTVATGDILTASSDTGASTAGSALAGGIAVAINLTGSASTQNAFLVQLKAAIEHANGHNGKITVSSVPTEANGAQAITLTQATAGYLGNRTISDDISQTTLAGFTGGISGWDYVGADVSVSDVDFSALYVGILERLTQISALFGQDQIGRQVRYSDGRRMTGPFGCPVRTLRNNATIKKLYPGDDTGKGVSELAQAHQYYMVDWWGNTRGEDVRRFPVRGFGIRPAWDPEDAYLDTNVTHRPSVNDIFDGVAAIATIAVADGDAASGMSENEKITITSTDGTVKNYIIVDDNASTVSTGDVVTSGSTDVGSTTATSTGVAVTIDLTGSAVTQNAFLVQLKAAIEHANGHNGKIIVSTVPTEANGVQYITLTQAELGDGGNITVTDDISQTTISGFSGGDFSDAHSGHANTVNNDGTNMGTADWFNPASALRVGDRGDGRGVRWPTVFNESMLMDVSEEHDATGLVLSHSTSEPVFGQGLVRPSNLTSQSGEIERGISDRVDLNSDDGLLKPSAHVGEGFETVNADTRGAEPVSRDDVRLGLDVDTIAELNDGTSREYVVMSTEATSLHTDREVGQRTNIRGAHDTGNRTLKDLDMTALNWVGQPVVGVVKHSNAHALWPLGGTYVMEWSRYAGNLDVKGWGKASVTSSSNPYQDTNHQQPILENINYSDNTIEFLYRPTYGLDYKYTQMFRPYVTLKAGSPQVGANFYRATAGGKYGMFVSDAPSARTGTPSSPPYAPVYTVDPSSPNAPDSQGPKIQGVDVTGYDKTDVRSPVARVVMSENTLEHFRADASRRSVDDDEGDYAVQPRHSQTLHPKGSKGDASYNTGDHSGE